ncbi:hypothetical protein GGR54DRAFT_444505 [Hypoxylon sp. NC1633]|nr:hypothetical protein GGR54DRAFT_444505 [Hypoxylon sp. NC1633]
MLTAPPPTPSQPSAAGCRAIVLYHTCGCRSSQPLYLCETNKCEHPTSNLLIGELPFACGSQQGRSEACEIEDRAKKEFVREVDTANQLETFFVLPGCTKADIEVIVPPFTGSNYQTWEEEINSRYERMQTLRSAEVMSRGIQMEVVIPKLQAQFDIEREEALKGERCGGEDQPGEDKGQPSEENHTTTAEPGFSPGAVDPLSFGSEQVEEGKQIKSTDIDQDDNGLDFTKDGEGESNVNVSSRKVATDDSGYESDVSSNTGRDVSDIHTDVDLPASIRSESNASHVGDGKGVNCNDNGNVNGERGGSEGEGKSESESDVDSHVDFETSKSTGLENQDQNESTAAGVNNTDQQYRYRSREDALDGWRGWRGMDDDAIDLILAIRKEHSNNVESGSAVSRIWSYFQVF